MSHLRIMETTVSYNSTNVIPVDFSDGCCTEANSSATNYTPRQEGGLFYLVPNHLLWADCQEVAKIFGQCLIFRKEDLRGVNRNSG